MRFHDLLPSLKEITPIAEGWRGKIFKAKLKGQDVTVKVAKRPEVEYALRKEAKILEMLKGVKGFPQLIMSGEDFLVYEFIKGIRLSDLSLDFKRKAEIYLKILEKAFFLDKMKINKDEFTRIEKNTLVDEQGEVYLIDFERGQLNSKRPTNVTQFIQLLRREGFLTIEEAKSLGKEYLLNPQKVVEYIRKRLLNA